MTLRDCSFLLITSLFISGQPLLPAQEFRVDNEIFEGSSKEPISESLTIFSGDTVYDFLIGSTEEITIFDIPRGRLIVLDPQRRMKMSFSTEELLEFCAATRVKAESRQKDELHNPDFQVEFDAERKVLTLNSDYLIYRATTTASQNAQAVQRFQQFADWYARLNALRPSNLPPFGRIALNEALATRNLIPEEIERTVIFERRGVNTRLIHRSHHAVNWLISNTDRRRIETAGNYLTNASFRQVSPTEYWQLGK